MPPVRNLDAARYAAAMIAQLQAPPPAAKPAETSSTAPGLVPSPPRTRPAVDTEALRTIRRRLMRRAGQ